MQSNNIQVESLTKRFGDFIAVNGISLQVDSGEIFGFLGPNGAGKSTTVGMLTTLVRPSSGTAMVGGFNVVKDARKVRQVAGVALQEIGLDPMMTSMELLTLQARMFGMNRQAAVDRAKELIELVRLQDAVDRRVGKYSGGMRRRLDLAMALVHNPAILFLDEPTTGLDPASRRDVWNEIRRLNQQLGMTIFLTTQYLEEADALAQRVAILVDGQIAIEGTPEGLKSEIGSQTISLTFASSEEATRADQQLQDIATNVNITRTQLDSKLLHLYLPHAASAVPAVFGHLESAGLRPEMLTLAQPTLDDVFLRVTGHRYAV